MNKEEILSAKMQEFRNAVDLLARASFDVVSGMHGEYITPRDPMGCKIYVDRGRRKLWDARAMDLSPISATFYTNQDYKTMAKAYCIYMARTMNDYMYRVMPTQSVSKLKNRFVKMSPKAKTEDYQKYFKNLFVKMVLESLGGSPIKLDALKGIEKKAIIADQRAKWDYQDDISQLSVFKSRTEALRAAIDLVNSMGLKSVNLSALYNAGNMVDYCLAACVDNFDEMDVGN